MKLTMQQIIDELEVYKSDFENCAYDDFCDPFMHFAVKQQYADCIKHVRDVFYKDILFRAFQQHKKLMKKRKECTHQYIPRDPKSKHDEMYICKLCGLQTSKEFI